MRDTKTGGQIQVYTGQGKGKTTASLGLAMRAAGSGKKVAIIYFDKGGNHYSERNILDRFPDQIKYFVTGRDRRKEGPGFDFEIREVDIEEAKRGLELAKELANQGTYDLLVLDEINTVTALGMLELNQVLDFLNSKPFYLELVLTGRNCPEAIMEKATLVTEMKEIKHYFKQGVPAREGFEY